MAAFGQVVTVPASASRTVGITLGSSAVTDSSAAAADAGRAITGTGIPAGCVIGNVTVSTGYNLYAPNEAGVLGLATATNASLSATLGGILVFQLFDGEVWAQLQATSSSYPLLPQYFKAMSNNDPLPLMVALPTTATDIYFGGSNVTASSTHVGADLKAVGSFTYNAIGGDSLFAVVGSSTAALQLLALRQA